MTRSEEQPFERRLEEALHDRVATMTRSPLSFADVHGRARRLRRRRTLAAGAGLAAVVALVVPVGLLASGALERSEDPLPAVIVPSPVPEPVLLDGDTPIGEPPSGGWVEGRFVHLPDGNTIRTGPAYEGLGFVDGHVLTWILDDDTGAWEVRDLAADGSVLSSSPSTGGAVISTDDTAAAWQAPDSSITVFAGGDVTSVDFDRPGRPVAVESGGEAVWLNVEGRDAGSVRVDSEGRESAPVPSAVVVNDVHRGGLVSATTEVDELAMTSCGGVFEDGTERWSTCDHTVQAFSPDGSWVQATDPWLDGAGPGTITVLDASDGTRQVRYDAGEGFIAQQVWEDATHLLLLHFSYDEQVWRVFRVGLGGSVEQALRPRRGSDLDQPVVLGQ